MPAADAALLNAVADELEDLRAGVDAISHLLGDLIRRVPPAIEAGDTIDLTLLLEGGATATVSDVAVRTMLPGDETYGDLGEHAGHAEHTH